MVNVVVGRDRIDVKLTRGEAFWGMHGSISIPGENVVGAQVLPKNWWKGLGLRVPGTGLPGLAIMGRFVWGQDRAYVSWTRAHKEVLQINLQGHKYSRVVLGVDNAKALADLINMAITEC